MMVKKLTLFISSLIIALPVYAVGIDRFGSAVTIFPGQQYQGKIVLSNPGASAVEIHAYLEDFEYLAPYHGEREFYPAGTIPSSLASWVSFTPPAFVLSPNGEQTVAFTITPDDSFTSARWAVLFFETIGASLDPDQTGVIVKSRVAYLIIASPATGRQELEFSGIKGGRYSLTGQLSDKGDTYLQVETTYYIIDSEGVPADRGELKNFYFFPEDKAPLEIAISEDLPPDNYTAVITLDINNGWDVMVKEIEFSLKSSGEVEIADIGEE